MVADIEKLGGGCWHLLLSNSGSGAQTIEVFLFALEFRVSM
jgi:hypothetical protein